MKKVKVGLLTMSDGREYLHKEAYNVNMKYQGDIARALTNTGFE